MFGCYGVSERRRKQEGPNVLLTVGRSSTSGGVFSIEIGEEGGREEADQNSDSRGVLLFPSTGEGVEEERLVPLLFTKKQPLLVVF